MCPLSFRVLAISAVLLTTRAYIPNEQLRFANAQPEKVYEPRVRRL